MSFVNYYQKPEPNEFSYLAVTVVVVSIMSIVCILWYQWALDNRYSTSRIEGKLLKKYNKKINENQQISASDVKLSPDGKTASATITVQNKGYKITDFTREVLTLPVVDVCSPMDYTCISL